MSDEEYEEYEYDDDYAYEENEEDVEAGTADDYQEPTTDKSASPPLGIQESSSKRKLVDVPPKTNQLVRQTSDSTQLVVPYDSYVIRSAADVKPLLDALIEEVSNMLGISADESQLLLHHMKWNKEKLLEKYFSDNESLRAEAGIDLYGDIRSLKKKEGSFTCNVCYDDYQFSDGASLGCGHYFCSDCYRNYLSSAVSEGPSCLVVHCMEPKCTQLILPSMFQKLVPAEMWTRYEEFSVRNFVKTSRNMSCCPAPRCDKVAVGSGITTIKCSCNFTYCFKCGEEAHDPSSCPQLSEWQEKCTNESETANWILANTRKCPNCNTRIEKNQGCNHMTCKVCRHEFCWICMGVWSLHNSNTGGYYKCNRYESASGENQGSAAQRAKAELDRYLHYYQRFHGHHQSLKFANAQREEAERKMLQQQESQRATWTDVEYLKDAAELIIQCRRVLKYSYVMGYFLKDGTSEKTLFEHHQEMLEKNTERLHECTELPAGKLDRTMVVNLTRVTEKFMASLLESLSGGIVRLDGDISTSASKDVSPSKL